VVAGGRFVVSVCVRQVARGVGMMSYTATAFALVSMWTIFVVCCTVIKHQIAVNLKKKKIKFSISNSGTMVPSFVIIRYLLFSAGAGAPTSNIDLGSIRLRIQNGHGGREALTRKWRTGALRQSTTPLTQTRREYTKPYIHTRYTPPRCGAQT
jgi:hypothetical protein